MIVGGYELHLYCDGDGCTAGEFGRYPKQTEFTAEEGSKARSAARRKGWRLDLKNGTALCPSCVARGAQLKTPPCPECSSDELCRPDCPVAPWNLDP